ncbi:MAG: hypothetical protein AB7S86_15645 [Hydrogenophaga sp.]|uniref:hypothetical protein n=1 Tax=Hydrogenophaga sp. TaxID=1904254 RepID=UPI003D10B5A2
MKPLIKPRWIPLVGWAVLVSAGLFCGYVLYARPPTFIGGAPAPVAPLAEKDSIEQALRNLSTLKSSGWLQRTIEQLTVDQTREIIAPAPEKRMDATDENTQLAPPDPSLRGAVVVRSGSRLYLVLGAQRYRLGERITTGETVHRLTLQTVDLLSPDGRTRTVEIGRGIGPAPAQKTW